MKVHHLNCGTCCPAGGRLFDGTSDAAFGHLVCHCLLIESEAGLILVDTGFGTRDIDHPTRRLSAFFRALNNIQLRPEETAVAQILKLGFDPADVRHIIVTHLDFDHAGGIKDFPHATVHVTACEKAVADDQQGGRFVGTRRYRPQQWDEVAHWSLYPLGGGERWFGFDCVRDLQGLPPEILLIPLTGHSWGHAGVAIREPGGWLLHAGDAYFHRGEMAPSGYSCPPGLRGYQAMMEIDRTARLLNQTKLRHLAASPDEEVHLFCAHDAVEFSLMARQTNSSAAASCLPQV